VEDCAAPVPRNHGTAALANFVRVQSCVVYGFTVYNTNAAAQYLCVFDADTLPADAQVPLFSWPLAAHNGVAFSYAPNGRKFDAGLVLCNSSTDAAKTIGAADCLFDVQYGLLVPEE
jgi:hypothetical protein